MNSLEHCRICPRECGVNRSLGQLGFCRQPASFSLARAALHFWEEPCISGTVGSGAVFFSGCNLQCVFCQNHSIAISNQGKDVSSSRLVEIYLELQEKGAANINLVTPTHFLPLILPTLEKAKSQGLRIPIVYNTSAYEKVDSLRLLEGFIDIYLPDCKYYSPQLSQKLSSAPDYFEKASAALAEMYRQVGKPILDADTGLMKRGMIVRHLCLPGQAKDTKKVLRYLHNTYGSNIYISILNQYTPMPQLGALPPETESLKHPLSREEYDKIIRFAQTIGIEQGFLQEGETQSQSFIPDFTFEGL